MPHIFAVKYTMNPVSYELSEEVAEDYCRNDGKQHCRELLCLYDGVQI